MPKIAATHLIGAASVSTCRPLAATLARSALRAERCRPRGFAHPRAPHGIALGFHGDGIRLAPRRGRQEQHRDLVEQQRHDEDEPPQHHFVGLAEQGGKIFHRPEVSLDGATLVIRLLKRRLLREGRRCGRPRPERPS